MEKQKFYVYIIQSKKDSYVYTGLTNDIERRLSEHNSGQVKPTKAHVPFELKHLEEFMNRHEARSREKFFKTGIGRELRNNILNTYIPR